MEKRQKAQRHREIVDCPLRQSVSAASGVRNGENRRQTREDRRKKRQKAQREFGEIEFGAGR
jgi:hypothetical protein